MEVEGAAGAAMGDEALAFFSEDGLYWRQRQGAGGQSTINVESINVLTVSQGTGGREKNDAEVLPLFRPEAMDFLV